MPEYSNSQIREIIHEYIHSERDREILCRRLIDGITYDKIADETFLSVRQIKRIVNRGETAIFKHIKIPD